MKNICFHVCFSTFCLIIGFESKLLAGIEDDYQRQQRYQCNYENAQYFSTNSDNKFCVTSNTFIEFSPNGYQYSSGKLNYQTKEFMLFGEIRIKKFRVEGNELVKYSCQGAVDSYEIECFGPTNRKIIGTKSYKQKKVKKLDQFKDTETQFSLIRKESDALNEKGISKGKRNKLKEAIIFFDKAISKDPTYFRPYVNRGLAKMKLKNYIGAINDLNKAIKIKPKDSDLYLNRGKVKVAIKKQYGACWDFGKAGSLGNKEGKMLYKKFCNGYYDNIFKN